MSLIILHGDVEPSPCFSMDTNRKLPLKTLSYAIVNKVKEIIKIWPPIQVNRIQTWTRTRITTNSNSSQRPNKSIIQNCKKKKWKCSKSTKTSASSFVFLFFCLCKCWWVIKTKDDKRKKKKEGVLEGLSFFFFPPFF